MPKAERHVFEALILTELKLIYWQPVLVLELREFVLLIAEKKFVKIKIHVLYYRAAVQAGQFSFAWANGFAEKPTVFGGAKRRYA